MSIMKINKTYKYKKKKKKKKKDILPIMSSDLLVEISWSPMR